MSTRFQIRSRGLRVRSLLTVILISLAFLFSATSASAQEDPNGYESTKRTEGGTYDDLRPLGSNENLVSTQLIVNGGFETGNFSGWTVSSPGGQGWYPWQVTLVNGGDGVTGVVQRSSPFAGAYSAWNGFCCNSTTNPEYIYQDITIPPSQNAVLTWSERIQSDLQSFCSPPSCGSNVFRVQILNPTTSAVIQTLLTVTAPGGAVTNTGWVTHTANLSGYAGQTVRLRFSTQYTSAIAGQFNGPGRAEIDAVSLVTSPSVVYMRSSTGQPWGQSTNEAAMNAVFGAGNWHDLRYETAVAADVFSSNIGVVFMEGGDFTANEMETFLSNNQVLIEAWVAAGGRLFLNAAPNEGNGMSYGFGSTQLVYPNFSGASTAFIATGQGSHPIFNTPFTPVGTSWTGNSFNHATISCPVGCTALIQSATGLPVLSSKQFGSGLVLFGGMTTTNFHQPQPQATNLRQNILYFLLNATLNTNSAPSAVADAYSTDEDTPLNVPANGVLGNDTDSDNDALTSILVSGPAHAQSFALNANGSFQYTPSANYFGGDSFTYKANDGHEDSNIVTVTLTIDPVNDPPTLANVPANAIIPELALYGFTATASDIENSPLVFSLVGAPAGASIDPNTGAFSWTPTEAQGPGVYPFTVRVTDIDGATNDLPISLDVQEVNVAPTLNGVPVAATINELALYNFNATANDLDIPAQTLVFSLVGAPAGASINPGTGTFSWTPSESQGPGVYPFTVRVSDGVVNTDASITLTVSEVNSAPVLNSIANQTVDEQTLLTVTASATDVDQPANVLTFSLDAAPVGMSIDPSTGAISWTPGESDGPGDYPVTVRVTDNATPNLSHTVSFSAHVNEVNTAPVLDSVGNKIVNEQSLLTFDANASDADNPANGLTFSLVSAPAGASIDPTTGIFTWTPTEAQGGNPNSQFVFTVRVTDNGTPALSDEEQITVTVNEVNSAPMLGAIANQSGYWGNVFAFAASATDPDIPANGLTFSLIGAPAGAAIDPVTGAFTWTPASGQIGPHTFTVRVTDNGTPSMSDQRSVTINVGRRPTTLVYTGDGSEQYSDQQTVSAVLTDNGGGTMQGLPLSGNSIGFVIGSQSTSGVTNGSGVATSNLVLTQDPNLIYTVASSFAGNAAYLPANDVDAFDILQEDARAYYTGVVFANTSCGTCSGATATLSATIRDITAETSDPAYDTFAGDIRNASVTFINRDTNTAIPGCANLDVGLVNLADQTVGTATCNWSVNLGSSDSLDFTVGIIVSRYYTRNDSGENTLVTISKPIGTNFITGGGYLINALSNGQYAGVTGLRTNFGFNVKYNSSGKNLQGNVNVIIRGSGGRVYQVKGNVMRTLSVRTVTNSPLVRSAVYTGKANVTDITDPLNPIALGGNNTFQMELTDNGEPGSTDTIGITTWSDAGGVLFSSRWNGTRTVEQLLGGGNVVVR